MGEEVFSSLFPARWGRGGGVMKRDSFQHSPVSIAIARYKSINQSFFFLCLLFRQRYGRESEGQWKQETHNASNSLDLTVLALVVNSPTSCLSLSVLRSERKEERFGVS